MTLQPSPYQMVRQAQDQIAVMSASLRAMERSVTMLAGMLDASAPDPFLTGGPADPCVTPIPPPSIKRVVGDHARTPVKFTLPDGTQIKTTERRVKLLRALMSDSLTFEQMVEARAVPTRDAAKQAIIDINAALARAGAPVAIQQVAKPAQRKGARGGREPALYALLPWPPEPKITAPELSSSAQNGGDAGLQPEEAEPARAAGNGEGIVTAQGSESITHADAGEGEAPPADPASAADEPNLPKRASEEVGGVVGACSASPPGGYTRSGENRTANAAANRVTGGERPAPFITSGRDKVLDLWATTSLTLLEIAGRAGVTKGTAQGYVKVYRAKGEPRVLAGDAARVIVAVPAPKSPPTLNPTFDALGIVAIDIRNHIIRGPAGDWQASAPVARTIARINSEGLFDIAVLLKAGPWPGSEAFRERIPGIKRGLSGIGVEFVEVPKAGFRIRIAEAA